jgi:hypothetical protein
LKRELDIRIGSWAGPALRTDSRVVVPCISFRTSGPRKESPTPPMCRPSPLYSFHPELTERSLRVRELPSGSYLSCDVHSRQTVRPCTHWGSFLYGPAVQRKGTAMSGDLPRQFVQRLRQPLTAERRACGNAHRTNNRRKEKHGRSNLRGSADHHEIPHDRKVRIEAWPRKHERVNIPVGYPTIIRV